VERTLEQNLSNSKEQKPMAETLDELLDELAAEPPQIKVTLKPSHRANVLAAVSVEIETELGTITINDGRILRNKAGQLWFSLPTFSIAVGKSYEYKPSAELSSALHQRVASAVLDEFERREKSHREFHGAL
jgi:hypothetical protein